MSLHKMTAKKSYTEAAMSGALAEVRANSLSLRAATKKYGVPTSSLGDRKTGRVEEGAKWGGKPLLSADQERALIDHAIKRSELGIGFTKTSFFRFAGQFAAERGVLFTGGVASEKWWRGLKQRHPDFALRSPEPTSAGRHIAMTRERICKYFAALKSVFEEHDLFQKPQSIWNMDETGLSLSHKPGKVLAKKGSKSIHCKMSNSRELITVLACGNAAGVCIPPHVIVPGKTNRALQSYDVENAPEGTNLSVSDSGWTKAGLARLWFTDTFLPYIGEERPQVLIFDGHDSHGHVELIGLARQENIILVELPSKTSNWTQPLDRTVFKSFKSKWSRVIQDFTSETGVAVGHAQFFRMFAKAWVSSMTVDNIRSGFISTGICPFNPGAIPSEAYTPSELYVDKSDDHVKVSSPHFSTRKSNLSTSVSEGLESIQPSNTPTDEKLAGSTVTVPVPANPELTGGDPFLPLPPSPSSPSQEDSLNAETSACLAYDVTIPVGCEVVDLPLCIDDGGLLSLVSATPESASILSPAPNAETKSQSATAVECSSDTALSVVESALTEELKRKYRHAYQTGVELDDSLFQTWKMYFGKTQPSKKQQTDLPLPVQEKAQSGRKRTLDKYFVISCDDAYLEKVRVSKEKELKKKQMEERKILRQKIKEEKESTKTKS